MLTQMRDNVFLIMNYSETTKDKYYDLHFYHQHPFANIAH